MFNTSSKTLAEGGADQGTCKGRYKNKNINNPLHVTHEISRVRTLVPLLSIYVVFENINTPEDVRRSGGIATGKGLW